MNKRMKREVETSAEYSFPDYMGDIKKILSARARCRDIGKLCADGTLEVNGVVEYEVIYADSENRLTAINTSSDYTVTAPINGEKYRDSLVNGRISNFSLRVTGPRKLSMRATVDSEICITQEPESGTFSDGIFLENQSERSTRVIKTEDYIYGAVLEREYAEEAERLPEMAGEELEIIGAGGNVRISEATATDGGAEIVGELILYAIVKTPNEPPFRISKTIPISESVEILGAQREMPIIPRAAVTSVSFGQNDDGEDKVIVANGIVEFSACAARNEEIEVVCDAYIVGKQTRGEYSPLFYDTLTEVKHEELEIVTKMPLVASPCENIRGIISSVAEIAECNAIISGKNAELSGKMNITLIACEINDDGSPSYVPIKHSFDFKENVNISSQIQENTVVKCTASVTDVSALIDANEIDLRVVVDAGLSLLEKNSIEKLDSLNVVSDISENEGLTVSVYYPTDTDTLFSVAKKYGKSLHSVAEANSLTESVFASNATTPLSGIKKLFVF